MGFCLSKSLLNIVEKQINQASRDVLDVRDSESGLRATLLINMQSRAEQADKRGGLADPAILPLALRWVSEQLSGHPVRFA